MNKNEICRGFQYEFHLFVCFFKRKLIISSSFRKRCGVWALTGHTFRNRTRLAFILKKTTDLMDVPFSIASTPSRWSASKRTSSKCGAFKATRYQKKTIPFDLPFFLVFNCKCPVLVYSSYLHPD